MMAPPSLVWIVFPLLVLFFIPIETLFLEWVEVGGIKPDLGLLLAYFFGVAWGKGKGLAVGLLFGGLQDMFSMGRLSLHFIFKGGIGFGAGLLDTVFHRISSEAHAGTIFILSLLHDFLGEIVLHGLNDTLVASSYLLVLRGLYNALFALIILSLLLKRERPHEGRVGRALQ